MQRLGHQTLTYITMQKVWTRIMKQQGVGNLETPRDSQTLKLGRYGTEMLMAAIYDGLWVVDLS